MASPLVLAGQAIGSCITVSDSTSLSALSIQGITVGTTVYNYSVGAYFALTVSTASLVTDQVVAVLGISGLRWIKQPSASSTVQAVTGPAVDNTDPHNPVVSVTATTSAAGLMSPGLFSYQPALSSTVIGDANTTVHPATEKRSLFIVHANVLTATRNLVLDNAGVIAKSYCWIIVEPQTHDLNIQDISSGTIMTVSANAQAQVAAAYCATTVWTANAFWWASN